LSNVPTNLIPTRITGLPEYTGSSTLGYMPYILEGRTYKVQFANIAAVGAVPSTREINTGTGLGGGGDLSANRTLYILPAGVDDSRLTVTGVTAGTYGAADTVPVLTINAQGRVTAATSAPIVLSNYVPTSRTITAGAGLTGGGALSSNLTFAVNFSSTTPEPLGVGSSGVSTVAARGDHVHPAVDLSDTTETQGVLPLSRGGTGNSLSPVVGAVAYSSNDKLYLTPTSGAAGQVLTSIGGTGAPIWTTLTGTGTVTGVSVVTANGFAGTVANPSTLPAITLSTTVSGLLKGDGTAISAATAGTDYVAPGAITTSGLTMATSRLLGRTSALTGAVEQITVGTGLSLSGGSLTNSAPDQTVSLTGAGGTTISGTYPNFTITSLAGTVTSVSGTGSVNGITLTGTVTSSGSLTLGGTLSNVSLTSQVTGTLPIANGGTGATSAGAARGNLGAAASGANTDITSIALTSGTVNNAPVNGTDLVNKTYADSISAGINFHQAVRLASAAALATYTYNNGSSGVGATITATANGALSIDGVAVATSDRVLIKNEVSGNAPYNGVYVVTQTGSGAAPFILTRSTDYNTAGTGVNQINQGDFFLVTAGSTQANTSWVQQTPLPITVGVTALTFTQFAAPIVYSAGTGLSLAGTVFSITNTGVSATTYGSASQVPVIAVNAQGQITSASNSSIAISGSQITSGTVAVAQGGTGASTLTSNALLKGNGTSAISASSITDTGTLITATNPVTLASSSRSAAAWTTSGINLIQSAATFTDTTSSGTVTDIRINNFAVQTLAASNPTTVTNFYGTYFTTPVAGANVTATNSYAIGAETLRVVNGTVLAGTLTAGGVVSFNNAGSATLTFGAAASTGTITLGQSTVSQTTNIQAGVTASGSTKTINIGTNGAAGSTTAITIGGTAGTSTTTLNGTVSLANALAVGSGGTGATTLTANGVLLGNGTSAVSATAVGSTGQVLVGNTGAAPTWATLSSSAVTSFSAGTTGLTPSSATTGAITLAGTLNVANGGTGATSFTAGYHLKGNGTSAVSSSVIYDDGTNVGIGTSSPTVLLDVFSATAANFSVRGDSATNITAHRSSTDASGPNMVMRKARGTSASPTAVASGDNMGTLFFSAYGGANNRNIASIAGTVDTFYSDTGIGSYLTFSTTPNGSVAIAERMRIDNAGNVGIGTASPSNKLDVFGTSSTTMRSYSTGTASSTYAAVHAGTGEGVNSVMYSYQSAGWYGLTTNHPMLFMTNNSERMRLDTSGNLGIGTTSPAQRIHAATTAAVSGTTQSFLRLTGDATYGADFGGGIIQGTGPIATISTVSAGTATERLRIDSSGNVGVATSTPQTRFEVYGGLIAGSENRQTHPNANAAGGFKAQWNYSSGSAETDLYNLYSTATESFRFYQTTGSGTAQILYSMLPTAHLFYTGGSERMRIDSSGNVGIGTSSPGSVLDVYGTSTTDIFHVRNGTTYFTAGVTNGTQVELNAYQTAVGAKLLSIQSAGGITNFGGNVGIGISTPSTLLHTLGSGSELRSQNTNTGQYFSARTRLKGPAGTYRSTALVHGNDNVGGTNTYFAIESSDTSDNYQSTIAYYNYANQYWQFNTSNTERMRISSSGYVAIGNSNTAPKFSVTLGTGFSWGSAWGGATAVFGGNGSGSGAGSGGLGISYDDTDGASLGALIPGVAWKAIRLFSDNLQFCTNGATERMRIDSSGAVGIGLSTPNASLHLQGIRGGNGRMTQSSTGGTSQTNLNIIASSSAGSADQWYSYGVSSSNYYYIQTGVGAGDSGLVINSNNRVMVGTSTAFDTTVGANFMSYGSSGSAAAFKVNATTTTQVSFYDSSQSARVGWIGTSGSSTSFNTTSDRRLKQNIQPVSDVGEKIDQIEIVSHQWRNGTDTVIPYGVIAQDLYEVAPHAVTKGDEGEEIGLEWGVDYSKLVPMMIKEMQSMRARIAELEGK
jgi:hypothetical protein